MRRASTTRTGIDEAALIRRAQQGDQDAFRQIYLANVGDVVAFLARRVDRPTAEDLAAETFIRAYRQLDRFEWRGVPIRAWLLRIAYRELVARWRRSSTHETPTHSGELPTSTTPSAEDVATADGLTGETQAALDALPETQRLVVELRFLRDLSVAETAVVLDMTEEAVRAASYRGMAALRSVLNRAEEP